MRILGTTLEKLNEAGEWVLFVPDEPQPLFIETPLAYDGRAKWSAWHRRAILHQGGDDTAWIAELLADIPKVCCGDDIHRWILANPPRWADYFAWTVEAHNAVNARCDSPLLTLEAAWRLWSDTP